MQTDLKMQCGQSGASLRVTQHYRKPLLVKYPTAQSTTSLLSAAQLPSWKIQCVQRKQKMTVACFLMSRPIKSYSQLSWFVHGWWVFWDAEPSILKPGQLVTPLYTLKQTKANWVALFDLKKGKSLSRVRLFATPWTVAHQAPPSMGFSRQECWSGLPFPSPGDLPHPGIEPGSPAS